MKNILQQHGISQINLIKSHNRSTIFTGVYNGQKKFIKYTSLTEKSYTIRSQYIFNTYINTLSTNQKIIIPHATFFEDKKYLLALFDFYEYEAFASTDPFKTNIIPNEHQTKLLIDFCVFLNSIEQKLIPEYFLQRVLTQNDYLKKMNTYLKPVIGKTVSPQQARDMQELFMSKKFNYRLCHHDFILWNMLNGQDTVVIVDAEHSRWGMQWYDIAYFTLQTYISLNQKNYAQEFLTKAFLTLKNTSIETEILIPSVYRLSAKLAEFKDDKEKLNRTHEMLEIILNENITNFLV